MRCTAIGGTRARGFAIACAIALVCGCGSGARGAVDASDGATTTIDVLAGSFGDPCARHVDCASGYCVQSAGGSGGTCSRTCSADCPAGFDCLGVAFPAATVDLCVPSTARLCLTCAADTECPAGACLVIDGGKHCAATCSSQSECPQGYLCSADGTGTHTGTYCQPITQTCTCNAQSAGTMRTCASANAIGTCLGTQVCAAATGWSACTARTASAEICDGIDNDCNSVIDDGVGGGEPCTNTVAGVGSCPGVRTCDGVSGFQCHGQPPRPESCNSIDDNCNGIVDEGFPGLGGVCNTGVGGCLRYGGMRCNAAGTGIECSAVAGAPATELCNHLDDDCNGLVDETFPTLGMLCSSGVGVCARYGSNVCNASGNGVTCSATPGSPMGAETCNYVDDDCDGTVDNGYRDPITGLYTSDANCGACGNDCTTLYTGANAFGRCAVTAGTPHCAMGCNAGTADLDASTVDGCEFVIDATTIYVSGGDATAIDDPTCGIGPTGTGAGNHPCATIGFGLARLTATARTRLDVADATYNEAVTLQSGKNLYGGYRADTWARHLATTSTVIEGVSSSGAHDRTVIANSITTATLFEGFVVRGSANTKPGGNSYAVYIANSSASLVMRSNQIFAGRGGPGAAGAPGPNGATGTNAAPYIAAQYDSFQTAGPGACNATSNRSPYGGALLTCPTANSVGGGNGGGNVCTPLRSTQNGTIAGGSGQAGAGAGGGVGGAPGSRGFDADLRNFGGDVCLLPIAGGGGTQVVPMGGTDGQAGGLAGNAPPVTGCTASSGTVVGGDWVGGSANVGVVAPNGGGGGGGGAGGGATCTGCTVGNHNAILGAHGGGGASGGCGGGGGGAGGAGGGTFGIFVTGGTTPSLTANTISGGNGGDGGTGGIGGAGGLGGTGGAGGQIGALFCSGKGGRGGDGGTGGSGGGGGGGCGGSSYGIYSSGVGSPAYCGANTVSIGAGGVAGGGGFSAGNPGGAGSAGAISACTSI